MMGLNIMLLADTLRRSQYILDELHRENSSQIVHSSPRHLVFNDGSSIYASSLGTLPTDIRVIRYDQLFIPRDLNGLYVEEVSLAQAIIASRSMVPIEFTVTILDE